MYAKEEPVRSVAEQNATVSFDAQKSACSFAAAETGAAESVTAACGFAPRRRGAAGLSVRAAQYT